MKRTCRTRVPPRLCNGLRALAPLFLSLSLLLGAFVGCSFSSSATPSTANMDGGLTQFGIDALIQRDAFLSSDSFIGAGADATCAQQSAMAQQLPLDLYVMMDSSGSMLDVTSTGATKWDAVRTALAGFLNDPSSAGIGVGIQYFPQFHATVPGQCLADADCGNFGPCFRLRTCSLSTTIVSCAQNTDCPGNQTCQLLGACAVSQGACAPVGQLCGVGDACGPLGGYCVGRDSCEVPPYATPAVAIAALPGAAAALIRSLNAHAPDGLTPTAPALTGALQIAQQRAATNPNHKVAVVLVTDGFPSECLPGDIPGIASIAAAGVAGNATGTPGVPTFVIGVFGPTEAATAAPNLNALAQGGGTGSAVVISTSQNVSQALQTALDKIRTTAVACQFQIPPANGGAIDFAKVNVQFTAGSPAVTAAVGYVRSKSSCDPARGGWYYDVDPTTGGTPSLISTCDATCSQFRANTAGRVDIVLGCQTFTIL